MALVNSIQVSTDRREPEPAEPGQTGLNSFVAIQPFYSNTIICSVNSFYFPSKQVTALEGSGLTLLQHAQDHT